MNRSQLRQRVKELLAMGITDPTVDAGRPSNSQINQAITEARNMIYMKLQSELPRRFGTSTTLSYTANAESVQLPQQARDMPIFVVQYNTPESNYKYVLDAATLAEFRNLSEYGDPSSFAVVDDKLYLRPKPQTTMKVTLNHTPIVNELTDTDEPTEIASPFHHIIAYGAAVRIRRGYGDPISELQDQFEEDFRTVVSHYETMFKDHHVQEVEQAQYYWGY